jgi:hypothetical protein
VLCFLESGDSSFTRHGRKAFEKRFECLPAFQIVEESLDRDSRSAKHRSSAKNIGVFDVNSHEKIASRQVEHPGRRGTKTAPLLRRASLKTAGMGTQRRFLELGVAI